MRYVKTKWVDNVTPVNADNLNKIEDAIFRLSSYSMTPHSIVQGNNTSVKVTESGNVIIEMLPLYINNVELTGNRTAGELGLVACELGKGLSSNDFTDDDKAKLDSINLRDYYNKDEVEILITNKINEALGR